MLKKIAEKFNRLSRVHQRHRRQTDDRRICDSIQRIVNASSRPLKRCKIDTYLQQNSYRKSYVAYRMPSVQMTLSDLKGILLFETCLAITLREVYHVLQAICLFTYCKYFICDFSYSCAAVDKISTDIVRRAVFLRQLSFSLLINDRLADKLQGVVVHLATFQRPEGWHGATSCSCQQQCTCPDVCYELMVCVTAAGIWCRLISLQRMFIITLLPEAASVTGIIGCSGNYMAVF